MSSGLRAIAASWYALWQFDTANQYDVKAGRHALAVAYHLYRYNPGLSKVAIELAPVN